MEEKVKIVKIEMRRSLEVEEIIAKEVPFTIFLNREEIATLLCSPGELRYLVIGFLATSGIIKGVDDIKALEIDHENGIARVMVNGMRKVLEKGPSKRIIGSGCGKAILFYELGDTVGLLPVLANIKVRSLEITGLMKIFNRSSSLFLKTGCVHSCAVCKDGVIIRLDNDIGRHNALDKVMGYCLVEGIPLDDKLILTSGRISSEVVIKAARCGVPLIASRCAVTDLSIKLGERIGVTLIGFIRGTKMNIYTHPERVIIDGE